MRKLIFCFDGTGNSPADAENKKDCRTSFAIKNITNVAKLHALLGGSFRRNDSPKNTFENQRSFYYSGIGTYGSSWIKRKANFYLAYMCGDIKKILKHAKDDLCKNYQDGDEIFIFGFSRGSAIAGMFATKIKEYNPKVKSVKFLGLFDMVESILSKSLIRLNRYPSSREIFEGEKGDLGAHIETAVHLVSLDERDIFYRPSLINKDKRVLELWLAGTHCDIGGGYKEDGLSDIALDFMCKRAQEKGLCFRQEEEIDYDEIQEESINAKISAEDIKIYPNHRAHLHNNTLSHVYTLFHILRNVRVNVDDRPSGDIPIIHHTVLDRCRDVSSYKPKALKNKKYRIMNKDGIIENAMG